jgi:O-antigen ligase
MDSANSPPLDGPRIIEWMQNAAIFAVCANLFSPALANFGFAAFLILFGVTCSSKACLYLDTKNFPVSVAAAVCVYITWQVIGLTYTDAPMSYSWQSIYTERKIVYILPLALVFTDDRPKQRFLRLLLLTSAVGLAISFALKIPLVNPGLKFNPAWVFRSHATQGMIFALCCFLSLWFGGQQRSKTRKYGLYGLAAAFFLNIAWVTPGRSGYVVFLVLLVWCFVLWRGFKGALIGMAAAFSVGVASFFVSSSIHDRVMEGVNETRNYTTDLEETSLGRRMVLYKTTLEMIRENPAFGVGTGGFKQHFSAIAAEKYTGWRALPFEDPQNQYFFALAENGLIGLGTFLLMLVVIIKRCLQGGIYGKMAAGCMLAWCATSLFSGHFRTFPEGHLIAFIVGILMVTRKPISPANPLVAEVP